MTDPLSPIYTVAETVVGKVWSPLKEAVSMLQPAPPVYKMLPRWDGTSLSAGRWSLVAGKLFILSLCSGKLISFGG